MSRIVVKNLPKRITVDRLKKHFSVGSSADSITDVKLKHDLNGNFRGFAFIGFKDEDSARVAVNHHNKTYLDNTKITVETYDPNAKPIKEVLNQHKTRKRVPQEVSKDEPKVKKPKFNPLEEFKDDPEFQEFLKVQKNLQSVNTKNNNYIWSDDVRLEADEDPNDRKTDETRDDRLPQVKPERIPKKPSKPKNKTPQEYLFTVKLSKLPFKVKKQMIKSFFDPLKTTRVKLPANIKGIAYVSFSSNDDLQKALLKHKSLMDGKSIDVHLFKNENFTKSGGDQGSIAALHATKTSGPAKSTLVPKEKKEYKEIKESVSETGRLYVRNLSYACTPDDLEELFSKFGEVTEVHLPIDPKTKINKGFAFISFLFPEHAIQSMDSLDKKIFQGRLLHILPGESKPVTSELNQMNPTHAPKLSSFKQKKQELKKQEIMKPEGWNSLFLSSNTVSDVVSSKFNVKKSDLLDASQSASDSIAVRMALGETQVVNETKKFLLDHGVCLDSFSHYDQSAESDAKSIKRSKNVILVKNLPANTESDEIKSLFTKYGHEVNRVILPKHGVTAIIEMADKIQAKKAFRKISVVKFKHVPLYLEWAPVDIFNQKMKDGQVTPADDPNQKDVNQSQGETNQNISGDDDRISSSSFTIFVKNINFDTTDESFFKHFSTCGKVTSAKISRRIKKKDGTDVNLSMGYGFVTYANKKSFDKSIRLLQHSKLDGHQLELSKSHQNIQQTQETSVPLSLAKTPSIRRATGTKIIVRNVPFEATQKEVEEMFRAFGGVKSVRLPKKMSGTGTHRGFAFVEFDTTTDAERSFESLSSSTHLYGRRLVLEWAKED